MGCPGQTVRHTTHKTQLTASEVVLWAPESPTLGMRTTTPNKVGHLLPSSRGGGESHTSPVAKDGPLETIPLSHTGEAAPPQTPPQTEEHEERTHKARSTPRMGHKRKRRTQGGGEEKGS